EDQQLQCRRSPTCGTKNFNRAGSSRRLTPAYPRFWVFFDCTFLDNSISYLYDFYEYSELDDSIPKYDVEMETFTADNATLNRVKKDSNFTIISAKLLRTNKIRNKLIGFMMKVLSLPNSWNFSMSGLKAICKEGKTAVHNAVNKLIDKGYLVRTKLLSNESVNNHFEYVYSFFDVPVSKEEADELEAETRRKAMLRKMADIGLSMEQNIALSPVVHRLAVEDMQLDLADFFDKRYDDAQFGEMLSLVNAYIAQAPAERYGLRNVCACIERLGGEFRMKYSEGTVKVEIGFLMYFLWLWRLFRMI
ncbi:MAG: hypothetical protein PUB97_10515, partial [Ruminococcus sp.]|nr:hypothetical protein [Ruminococcus sp.]